MKYHLLAASILATIGGTASAATYQLEELATLAGAKQGYITAANNNGEVIGAARGVYQLPIDISYIDFEDSSLKSAYDTAVRNFELVDKIITFTLDDIEQGNINADAHSFMLTFLSNQSTNPEWQKISDSLAVEYTAGAEEQVLFDIESADYDGLTRSVANFYNGLTDDGVKVGWGSAPYSKINFTADGEEEETTYFVRDFMTRALVISSSGVKHELAPLYAEHGGISTANDIVRTSNGHYLIAGDSSTGVPQDRQDSFDDNCDGLEQPVEVCVWRYQNSTTAPFYERRATLWTLDSDLGVISAENLGLGLTPLDDEDKAFRSTAMGVNRNGLVVGYSEVRYKDEDLRISMPVYFKDGEVHEFVDQDDSWYAGKALAVNDSGVIVGYSTKRIEGSERTKFFYHDVNTGTTVYPEDYFSSSSSVAHAINADGMIVGEGETDISNSSNRRREAFVYTPGQDAITNLNSLLPCYADDGESRYPYVVSQATAINDAGEIFGVATKTVEKRDSLGEIVVDSEGKVEYESIAVPVKLSPINGEIESCAAEAQETYQRQGASFGWLALLLLPLTMLRRFMRK